MENSKIIDVCLGTRGRRVAYDKQRLFARIARVSNFQLMREWHLPFKGIINFYTIIIKYTSSPRHWIIAFSLHYSFSCLGGDH